jgi:hypothetical protein
VCLAAGVPLGATLDLAGAQKAAGAFLGAHVAISAAACVLAVPLGAGRSLARGRVLVAGVKAAFVAASLLTALQHPALGWAAAFAAGVALGLGGLVGSLSSQLPFLVTAALAPLVAAVGAGASCLQWTCGRAALDQVFGFRQLKMCLF